MLKISSDKNSTFYQTPNGYVLALLDKRGLDEYKNLSAYGEMPFFMRKDFVARQAKAYMNPIYGEISKEIDGHTIYFLSQMDKVIILEQKEDFALVAIHTSIIVAIVPQQSDANGQQEEQQDENKRKS